MKSSVREERLCLMMGTLVCTIFNSVLPSQIHICFYIGLLQYCKQITYITVSSQSARFEDNNTH